MNYKLKKKKNIAAKSSPPSFLPHFLAFSDSFPWKISVFSRNMSNEENITSIEAVHNSGGDSSNALGNFVT